MLKAIAILSLVGFLVQGDEAWKSAKRNMDRVLNNGTPQEKADAIRGLGRASSTALDLKTAEAIVRVLGQELGKSDERNVSSDVLAACVDVLRNLRSTEAVDHLISVASKNGSWRKRYYVIKALSAYPSPRITDALITLVYPKGKKANEAHVATAALGALADRADKKAIDVFHRALKDIELPWDARLEALRGIAQIGDPSSPKRIAEALRSVSDAQARLKSQMIEVLQKMTGIKMGSGDSKEWMERIGKGGGKNGGGHEGTQIRPTTFFGLKTKSTRIIFVLDKSLSMKEAASYKGEEPPPPPVPEDMIGTGGIKDRGRSVKAKDPLDPKRVLNDTEKAAYEQMKGLYEKWKAATVSTRLELLKKEFCRALFWVDHRVMFGVFFYSNGVDVLTPQMIPATWANKVQIMRKVEAVTPDGFTNTGDALLGHALNMVAKRGRTGKYDGPPTIKTGSPGRGHIETVAGPDTIYLLTDGEPNAGRYSPVPDPANNLSGNDALPGIHKATKENIMNELKKVVAVRKVIIHTILVADRGTGGSHMDNIDPNFMRGIAELTKGQFKHVSGR